MFAISTFPKAILHVDGDAFFASCEQSRRPELKGKPVITGKERGIASSLSYEAKARGVTRAMPLHEIRQLCPDAVILPSDYETYSLLSRRLYAIVRRYTHAVEEYGIDECFADLTGYADSESGYVELAKNIKHDLDTELGFTFSVGLAPSKVLAKVGSKWKKPSGLTTISARERWKFLDKLPVGYVWGIGTATSLFLRRHSIATAGDFARANEWWVKTNLARPFWEIWQELNGASVMPLQLEEKSSYYSIQKFKTFTPPSKDPEFIFSQLSKNIENACIKARRHKLIASSAAVVLRTQDFRHFGVEIKLPRPTATPQEIISVAREVFATLFKSKTDYRATGIILSDLNPNVVQPDLFNSGAQIQKMNRLYSGMDALAQRFGKHTIFLGSSFDVRLRSATPDKPNHSRHDIPERQKEKLIGENKRRRLSIPMLFARV